MKFSEIKIDLSDQKFLKKYLRASLSMSGACEDQSYYSYSMACKWYANLMGIGFNRLPFFLVHDLGLLLLTGNQFPFAILGENRKELWSEEKTSKDKLRSNYENRVLNRVLTLPVFHECYDIIAENKQNPEIIGLFLERILSPLQEIELPVVIATPHIIRSVSVLGYLDAQECVEEIDSKIRSQFPEYFEDGNTENIFEIQSRVISDIFEMLSLRKAIGPEDLFIARHYNVYPTRAQRLIGRQIAEFEGLLGESPSPPSDWVPETPEVKVELEDAGFFPQGGLDEMSNRGSFENLVQSQLAFMEKTKGPDIFSLRFVEGELLFYTRDEGQLLRRARALHVVLDLSPEYDFHYPSQPARLSVLLQSFVNRFVEDIFSLFEMDSIQVILHTLGEKNSQITNSFLIRFSERVARAEVKVEKSNFLDLESIPSPYLVPGRVTTLLYLGPQEPPQEKLREMHYRSGMGIFWATLNLEEEENWRFLEQTPRAQWGFKIGASTKHILPTLSALKTQLVWRNFGS